MNPPRWNTPYADRLRGDLVQLVEHTDEADEPYSVRRATADRIPDRRRFVVTGVVAVAVVLAAVFAIRAGLDRPLRDSAVQPTQGVASATTTPTRPAAEATAELQAALSAILPKSASTAPAMTWTDAREGATGGAIDTGGKTMLLAAACEGGGTLTVTVSGSNVTKPDRVLDCSRLSTLGPLDLSAAGGTDPPGPVGFDVQVSSGHPRFLAKAVAIDDALARGFGTAP